MYKELNVLEKSLNHYYVICCSFQPGAPKFPPKAFIVDLIHEPGHLMRSDCPEAITYQQI